MTGVGELRTEAADKGRSWIFGATACVLEDDAEGGLIIGASACVRTGGVAALMLSSSVDANCLVPWLAVLRGGDFVGLPLKYSPYRLVMGGNGGLRRVPGGRANNPLPSLSWGALGSSEAPGPR